MKHTGEMHMEMARRGIGSGGCAECCGEGQRARELSVGWDTRPPLCLLMHPCTGARHPPHPERTSRQSAWPWEQQQLQQQWRWRQAELWGSWPCRQAGGRGADAGTGSQRLPHRDNQPNGCRQMSGTGRKCAHAADRQSRRASSQEVFWEPAAKTHERELRQRR